MHKPPDNNGPDHGNSAASNGAPHNQLDLIALYQGARAITDEIRRQLLSFTLFAFLQVFGFHEMGGLRQKRLPQTVAAEEDHLRTVRRIWLGLDTIRLDDLVPCDIGNMCAAVRNAQKSETQETDRISSYNALVGSTAGLLRFLAGPPFELFSKQRLEELLNMIKLEGSEPPTKCPQTCSKDKSVKTTATQQPNIGSEGVSSSENTAAPVAHDTPAEFDEAQVMAELKLALVSGVTDIDSDLRQRACLLPTRAFVDLYAIDWCQHLRGLDAAKERQQLLRVCDMCNEFRLTPLAIIADGATDALKATLEAAETELGYKSRTCRYLGLTAGRLVQFLAAPPFELIEVDRACRLLTALDFEGKSRAANRLRAQLNTWSRTVRWRESLDQVQREDRLNRVDPILTEEKKTCCTEFLRLNGQGLDGVGDRSFVNAVRLALNGSKTGRAASIRFPEGSLNLPNYRDQVDSVLRTCEALAEGNFPIAVRRHLPLAGNLSHEEIGERCGLAPGLLHSILDHKTAGPTNISAPKALQLDALLHARGNLFSSYAVTTQEYAYEYIPPVIDVILNRTSFGQKLRTLRVSKNLTCLQLVRAVQARAARKNTQQKIDRQADGQEEAVGPIQRFNEIQLNQWEQGISLPCEAMAEVVEGLDEILDAGSTLKDSWRAEGPRRVLEAYALRLEDSPEDLQRQIHRLVLYRTCNPEGLEEGSGDRWNCDGTESRFWSFCHHFFGYLVHHKGFQKEDLSVSLMCDFALLLAFFIFLRDRSKRKHHSLFAKTITLTLLQLYPHYMPHIAEEAAREKHWQKLFQSSGVSSFKLFWNKELARTIRRSRSFINNNKFSSERLTRRADRLLEEGIGVSHILAELESRSERMPVLIRTPRAAVLSRRLVLATLVTLHLYRAPVLLALKVTENI